MAASGIETGVEQVAGSETDADRRALAAELAQARAALAQARNDNAMLRETLDAVDAGICVYGPDLRFRFANRAYHRFYPHLPSDGILTGEPFEAVLARSFAAGVVSDPDAARDFKTFAARRRAEMLDRGNMTRDSHNAVLNRWSQIRVNWTPSGNRVSLRVDVSAIKRLEQELRRTQRMETIGRIAGGVAQDFNNLLTVIIGNLEMLRLRPDDAPRVAQFADSAIAAAETGATLIRQLLTFTRRDIPRLEMLAPNDLLEAMAALLHRTAGAAVRLTLDLDPSTGTACFDAQQFEAAIINLVLNARDAIGDAAGEIVISTRPAGERVEISIADSGRGMAPEVAAQAFEPFFTTKPVGTGPGLGLSQVYGFATSAGGDAAIDSTPGRGTRVIMLVPRKKPPEDVRP